MIKSAVAAITHFIHARFIWLLLGSYVVAGIFPGLGLQLREVSLVSAKLPMLMLGFLLFNAGLGVEVSELKQLWKRPGCLWLGLVANLIIPIAYIWGVSHTMQLWHNPDEVQNILVGLALVRPYLKLSNSAVLLLLNYSNAAISLPQTIADFDLDFLAVTLAITLGLCVATFAAGWLIRELHHQQSDFRQIR